MKKLLLIALIAALCCVGCNENKREDREMYLRWYISESDKYIHANSEFIKASRANDMDKMIFWDSVAIAHSSKMRLYLKEL